MTDRLEAQAAEAFASVPAEAGLICQSYVAFGVCRFGNNCWHVHPSVGVQKPLYCLHFIAGNCRHGSACWYRHEYPPPPPAIVQQPNVSDKLVAMMLISKLSRMFAHLGYTNVSCVTDDIESDTSQVPVLRDAGIGDPHPFGRVGRKIAQFLLPVGVKRHYEACVTLCRMWPVQLMGSWPGDAYLEPAPGHGLSAWRGVKKCDDDKNFILELDLMVRAGLRYSCAACKLIVTL